MKDIVDLRQHALPLGVLLVLLLLPVFTGSYVQGVVVKMMAFALFAVSLNIILGYGGMASLGHAAFFGVGAYVVAKMSTSGFEGLWLPLLLAVVLSTFTAAVFGLLTLRARGAYLLMITLALAQVLWGIAYSWKAFTGADDGIPGVGRPESVLLWDLSGSTGYYYFVLMIFAVVMFLTGLFVASAFGRALLGIRENERRMLVLGYPVWAYKYLACVVSGGLAGLAGALMAWQNGFVGPSYLSVAYSAMVLIMVILGGAGTLYGPVLGAFIIIGLENYISGITDRWVLILGLIYVLVTLFAPNGVVGLFALRKKGTAS